MKLRWSPPETPTIDIILLSHLIIIQSNKLSTIASGMTSGSFSLQEAEMTTPLVSDYLREVPLWDSIRHEVLMVSGVQSRDWLTQWANDFEICQNCCCWVRGEILYFGMAFKCSIPIYKFLPDNYRSHFRAIYEIENNFPKPDEIIKFSRP